MASNSNSIFTKVSVNAKGLFIPKYHIQAASKVGHRSGSSNISSNSDIIEFNHPVHGLITTTKKKMNVPESSAPSSTPVIPGTPTSSKGPQELLEDEKFIDQQLARFAIEQRKLELRFQSYRDHKIEFIRKHALDDAMKPNDQIKHAAMIAAADPKVQDEGDGHISLKSYADMLKSATVHLPSLIKEQLDANHIQEWSEGTPE